MQCHQRQVDFSEIFRHFEQVCEKRFCGVYQMLLASMNKLIHLPWWFRTTWILVPLFARTESLNTTKHNSILLEVLDLFEE